MMMRNDTSRIQVLSALLYAAVVVAFANAASAQVGQGAGVNRPSMQTLRSLDNTLGNYVRHGQAGLSRPSDVASVNSSPVPGSIAGRRGLGSPLSGSRMDSSMSPSLLGGAARGGGLLRGSRGGLLARDSNNFMAPLPLSGFADVSRFSASRDKPGLLLRRQGASNSEVGTGAEPLVQPDVAVRRDVLAETGVAGSTGGAQVSLEALVQSYVSSRRETYMAQGWQRFKNREYRVATDLFSMADSVSASEPASRIPIKRAIVVAGIASRQYSLAANALAWLLSDDPISKTARDPAVLENLAGFVSNYGTTEECKGDWTEHAGALVALANANPGSVDTQALRVVVLWGQNDRSAAEFYARKLTSAGEGGVSVPWSRLLTSLQAAGQSRPVARLTATGPAMITMDAPVADW